MRNFLELLKKEIRELLTKQLILPFVIMMVIFMLVGQFLEGEIENAQDPVRLVILDLDQSDLSGSIPTLLEEVGYEVEVEKDKTVEEVNEKVSSDDADSVIILPKEMQEDLSRNERVEIQTFSVIKGFSIVKAGRSAGVEGITQTLNEVISTQLIAQVTESEDPTFYKQPVDTLHIVEVNGKEAEVSPSVVLNYILSQVTFIPIILFLVITVASQLVATAVATEKENKTLETLLATPISRKAIVATKLIAAGLISLLIAAFYMYGLQNINTSITGGGVETFSTGSESAIEQLGLQLTTSDYLVLGFVIFLGILVALSLAFILGSFANDSRSAQSVIAPVMLMLLIPYLLTMFVDIDSASNLVKGILYLIPFTYTFTAASNLMLNNYEIISVGIVYNIALIIIMVIIASKIFSSDKILTLKLPKIFSKKRSFTL